jgi:hypothetical protein
LHPLHRSQKSREIFLLLGQEIQAIPLHREQRIHERGHVRLISGNSRPQLLLQSLAESLLALRQSAALLAKLLVGLPQLRHLRVIEPQPIPHDLGKPPSNLLLERSPKRPRLRLPCSGRGARLRWHLPLRT